MRVRAISRAMVGGNDKPMAKSTKSGSRSKVNPRNKSVRGDLAKLRRSGLYKPKDARAKPTRYGKSLIAKFADFLTGTAKSVKVSSKIAKQYEGGDRPGTVRRVRNRIVVPAQPDERVTYSAKTGKVRATRRSGKTRYVREPLTGKHTTFESVRRQMRPGDRVAVPFYRGRRGTEWVNMTLDEFEAFMSEYSERYKDAPQHVELYHTENVR